MDPQKLLLPQSGSLIDLEHLVLNPLGMMGLTIRISIWPGLASTLRTSCVSLDLGGHVNPVMGGRQLTLVHQLVLLVW